MYSLLVILMFLLCVVTKQISSSTEYLSFNLGWHFKPGPAFKQTLDKVTYSTDAN